MLTRATGTRVAVLGTGAYVPARTVSNTEVGGPAGVDDAWIRTKTGIRERRWAGVEEATSDLAVAAAREAIARADIDPDDLTLIIVATSTPDHPQPATASLVQHRLGATRAAAFDLNAVCTGFVFALTVAARMAATGGHALVIGADVYSRILDPADRRTVVLFGDGAGAVVLGPAGPDRGLLGTSLHSFGDRSELIQVLAGGSRLPARAEVLADGRQYFTMRGRAVREFVEDNVPQLTKHFLGELGLGNHDVDHVVPHQANGMMLAALEPRLDLPGATLHSTVDRFGNTGAASIPITLHEAARSGALRPGQSVLLIGFGGGMAVGMGLLRW